MQPKTVELHDECRCREIDSFLTDRIYEFNAKSTGYGDGRLLAGTIHDGRGEIIAGINGHTWGGCCEITHVWVHERHRGKGLGRALVLAAESEAVHRGCEQVVPMTHSFQAPPFYEHLGYERKYSIENQPKGYAEYTSVPATNVVGLRTTLSWAELAAIPESYVTAWCCLFVREPLRRTSVLLIRGATSALGQAAVNLAVHAGVTVLGTTRSESKRPLLHSLGASGIFIEGGDLANPVREAYPDGIDCVLDLVGNRTVYDSLKMVRKGGRVVMAGFLGGHAPVSFDTISSLQTGVDLTFFGSAFVLGNKDYPLSNVPLHTIIDKVEQGIYQAKPSRVFDFNQIPEAHRFMESNNANGKIVIVV